jgi:hypothetical protein
MKIDSEFLNHALWRPHYRERDFRQKCAAETQAKRIVYPELVALGVSAEVVVVLKDEDASLATGCLAAEVCG